jgi:hypothetical protein
MRTALGVLACIVVAACLGVSVLKGMERQSTVARVVVWEPTPGMAKEMEQGYTRHLDWHRRNHDWWAWNGWTITSGDRFGYFVDGTFSHTWKELDTPVAPAADAADNAVNVLPYASVRSASVYEELPELSNLGAGQLQLPLMTFCYLDVMPGTGAEFERVLGKLLTADRHPVPHAVLRSATEASRYLLMLPAEHVSKLQEQAEFVSHVLQAAAHEENGKSLVEHVREETARRRPELSYAPERLPR